MNRILVHGVGFGSWSLILCKALFTAIIGLIGLRLFNGLNSNSYYSTSR